MADDYSISAKITADTSGFEKGVKKAQTASKNLSNSVSGVIKGLGKSGLVGALGAVGLATNGVTAVLGVAKKAFQEVSKTINECSEAYRKQYQSEIALETAIKNNPLVDGSATRGLKQFASEIQSVSNLGDEELLPMMADLIAKGRTEAETMNIIRVATDMSASGTISFENAIQQLNATLNGNIGRLGMQNAELKDLTAEELKNGKAVEILGNKYKGLAEATADTKKQLNNAIGDLKETLGQVFENAFSPMRKYFTEVISNLNNSINKSRELKGAMKDVFKGDEVNIEASTENLQIMWSETLHKQQEVTKNYSQYMQLYGKYIDEATDETLQAYKKQIADLNANLKTISDELNRRKTEAEKEKREAQEAEEKKKKQTELAELEKKQAEEREKSLKLQNEWEDKLFTSRLEHLEKSRERELKNDTLTAKEKFDINTYYGDMILSMRIKQLEKEREEALSQEGLTEETRETINAYYEGKITEARQAEAEKRGEIAEEEGEKEKEVAKVSFTAIVAMAKQATKKMAEVFKKVAETIKKVFSAIGSFIKDSFNAIKNIFSKLFEFNVSDALDNLLKVEDAILTFFVETLPKLPSFFESAFSSVLVLIQTLINAINWEKVQKILTSIVETFVKYAPQILSGIVTLFTGLVETITTVLVEKAPDLVKAVGQMFFTILEALPAIIRNFIRVVGTYISEIGSYITENGERLTNDLVNLVQSIVDGITEFIEGGGWRNLLSAILTIQKAIENAVAENLPALVDTIIEGMPDLIQFLTDSIVSAQKTLSRIMKPILKLIVKLIEAIVEVIFSDEVLDTSMEVVEAFFEALTEVAIEVMPKVLPKIVAKLIKTAIRTLASFPVEIAKAFLTGISKAFSKTNWSQFVKDLFSGFIDGIKELFGIHSPSKLFEDFGLFMVEGLVNGLKGISESCMMVINPFLNTLSEAFSETLGAVVDSVKSIVDGFVSLGSISFDALKDIISVIANASFGSVVDSLKVIKDTLVEMSRLSFNSIIGLTNVSLEGLRSTLSGTFDGLYRLTTLGLGGITSSVSTLSSALSKMAQVSFSGLNSGITATANGVASITNAVTNLVNSLSNLIDKANKAVEALNPLSSVKSAGSSIWSGITSLFGFATGTQQAPKGLALVGEAGPELVKFNGGEQVLNAKNTQKALAGVGGKSNTFNVTFNNLQDTSAFAMIQQLKQYNRQMAINGVI